jgi:HEAT repeat protein
VEEPSHVEKKRSHRIYVLWGVALALLVSTAIFCWAVVVPVWQTRRALLRVEEKGGDALLAIKTLGGEARAVRRLRAYLRLPHWLAHGRRQVPALLGACAKTEPAATLDALEMALSDSDAEVRSSAAYGLSEFNLRYPPAVTLLVEVGLKHADPRVRRRSADCLGGPGSFSSRTVPALTEALKDQDAEMRYCAARALGFTGPDARSAVPGLIEALSDGSARVRTAAAFALGELRVSTKEVVSALEKASADADYSVAAKAASALRKLREPLKAQ